MFRWQLGFTSFDVANAAFPWRPAEIVRPVAVPSRTTSQCQYVVTHLHKRSKEAEEQTGSCSSAKLTLFSRVSAASVYKPSAVATAHNGRFLPMRTWLGNHGETGGSRLNSSVCLAVGKPPSR